MEFQDLHMREWLSRLKAGNVWNCCMSSDVEENLVGLQFTRAPVVQIHFSTSRPDETSAAHDQLGAARLVDLQVLRNLPFDHRALAPTNRCHIDSDGTGQAAVFA